MQHSVYDLVNNQFTRNLISLKGLLGKAREHAKARNFDENKLLTMAIAPDMFNFRKQVQVVTDNAKAAAARLSGKTAPVFEDNDQNFDELLERIDKTISFLATIQPEDYKDYTDRKAKFPWNPTVHLKAEDYLSSYIFPNFYFHLTTAYNILRGAGVEIGKSNYMGELNWIKE